MVDKSVDLSKIWLFSACSKSELEVIARLIEQVKISNGKVLCNEGELGREFFFILNGTATVQRGGSKIATLTEGQYFGELSLLDKMPRSATVTASTNMTLLVIDRRQFIGILDAFPSISRKLLAAMASRIRESDQKAIH
ncbi:MAG: cyclic nucleotide-binding domain-containing protein [Actinobacteria bacterium]|nr:cyclic nucleotide-binding domain-containing protein [Actinomycetota bacterium]MCL6104256.1 cyclic nucleotide-binding domain-containing protein [Actinomycetota bacterium]